MDMENSAAAAAACGGMTLVSKSIVYPTQPSTLGLLKLSVSDLPMLSCHYIQKGLLFPPPTSPSSFPQLVSHLQFSLSKVLTHFPALAGRLLTDPSDATIFVSCNDAGVPFSHYRITATTTAIEEEILHGSINGDVSAWVKNLFFDLDGAVSYQGHHLPLASVRVTELSDGSIFIGCAVNHSIADGTSFWNFFNSWAELCRGTDHDTTTISHNPDFRRNYFGDSTAVLKFPDRKAPVVTFPVDVPLRERIFHFSADAIRQLKSMVNNSNNSTGDDDNKSEIYGKQANDMFRRVAEVSSLQSLCALLWKHVTKARKLETTTMATTFRMAVNCRKRVVPAVDAHYFGNAIQSIPTVVSAAEVASSGLAWVAGLLRDNVAAHIDAKVREKVKVWEKAPRCFPLGNPDGAGLTMGSSPRFPIYDNDFGWGKPVAVRSGRANKFDGKMSAFPGRGGGVDVEVCLAPETMGELFADEEFLKYVSSLES